MGAYASYLIETFITLLAVCALAFVVLASARRFGIGKAKGPIELVGQLPLDARRAIYLVRVGSQVIVVGVGEGGFTKLAELASSEIPKDVVGSSPPFADILARVLGRPREGASKDDPS